MDRGGIETQSDTSSDTPSESRGGEHRDWRSEPGAMPLCYTNEVDHVKNRFPHCIVWTPIPLITYVLIVKPDGYVWFSARKEMKRRGWTLIRNAI